jgi:hypothetical protein
MNVIFISIIFYDLFFLSLCQLNNRTIGTKNTVKIKDDRSPPMITQANHFSIQLLFLLPLQWEAYQQPLKELSLGLVAYDLFLQ